MPHQLSSEEEKGMSAAWMYVIIILIFIALLYWFYRMTSGPGDIFGPKVGGFGAMDALNYF